ncbi:MAG: YncE family protein [Planctomycetota bacterium]|jgi:YVTN family beta-propeller protein
MQGTKRLQVAAGVVAVAAAAAPATAQMTGTLVVLNKAEASASILDLASGKETGRLPTGEGPHEVAISPDGRTAVVANYGARHGGDTLTVIDLHKLRPQDAAVRGKQEVTKTIELGDHHRPHGIEYMADGKRVVVTAEAEQYVLVVDVEAGEKVHAIKTGQRVTHMVVLGAQEKRAYASSIGSGTVSVLDLESGVVVETIKTGEGAEGIDIAPDGREVWVSNRGADTLSIIDTGTLEVVETLACADFPIRLKFTPDGGHVLVSNARSGDVAVFDAKTRREVHRISMQEVAVEDTDGRLFQDTGRGPVPVGILVMPDGRHALVANTNADIVTVLDLEVWGIVGRLKGGKEPDGMAYSPLVLSRGSRR